MAYTQQSSLSTFQDDDHAFTFGGSDSEDDTFNTNEKVKSSNVTYKYPELPVLQAKQSPLLSDRPLPPAQYAHNLYALDQGPLDQYRSTQLQSPTFSEPASEASTTVSPRDIFADDHIAHKTYPSLFPPNRTSSASPSVGSYTPRTPVDDHSTWAQPSRLSNLRQESVDSHASYSSYASTSSEDEDALAPHALMIPEPKSYSNSYPKHMRSTSISNATTHLSPSLACLATSPKRNGPVDAGKTAVHLGFRPLEPERRVEQEAMHEERERASSPSTVHGDEELRIAPIRLPITGLNKKRASPFGDEVEEEEWAYHSSASDDDEDEYVERPKARRTSSASQAPQQSKPKKKKVDIRNNRGPSVAPASATPREGSVARGASPEATCWCPVPGCLDTKGFVRTYDLKRHEETVHPTLGAGAPQRHFCVPCGRSFSRKDALIRHEKTIDHSAGAVRRGPNGGGGRKK